MNTKYYTSNTFFKSNEKIIGVAFRIPKDKVKDNFDINDIVIIEICENSK
jgi:uncharacterized protein YkuJ